LFRNHMDRFQTVFLFADHWASVATR
jgi:hypothetical protein